MDDGITTYAECVAMREVTADRLKRVVEIDETYIGGKSIGHAGKLKSKVWIVGAVQRDGQIRLQVVAQANRYSIEKFIAGVKNPTCEAIYADDSQIYNLIDDMETRHESVKHGANVHTNNVENVWSLFKRGICGDIIAS
jgi:hypothetical protein